MPRDCGGFTILELLIVITVVAVISAIALPVVQGYYGRVCLEAAAFEIEAMIREAKQLALSDGDYAIVFDPAKESISLVSARGSDGVWNTSDDKVVRTLNLADKGRNLCFGYGSYGKIPAYAATEDGVTFQRNILVCNDQLTGNAGTLYIRSTTGGAIAIVMNSVDFGYTIYRWKGRWVRG